MCVVCASERNGRLNSLVPIILQARPIRFVSLRLWTVS